MTLFPHQEGYLIKDTETENKGVLYRSSIKFTTEELPEIRLTAYLKLQVDWKGLLRSEKSSLRIRANFIIKL